jgi:P4 family phage/plasmid primase-like protien
VAYIEISRGQAKNMATHQPRLSSLDDYLRTHLAGKDGVSTNTRIGANDPKVYGGNYFIPDMERSEFLKLYYQHVFVNKKLEYLTEKQLLEDGPILVDLDFRYDKTVYTDRQHSRDHIQDLLFLYMDQIAKLVHVQENVDIDVFVMEKTSVNVTDQCTKDGIHLLIGLKMHKGLQVLLRQRVMTAIKSIWDDLRFINSWDDVFDEAVTKGQVNWQMYGSRKPGNQAYMLTEHVVFQYAELAAEWKQEIKSLASFNTERHLERLSARYRGYPAFAMLDTVQQEFDLAVETLARKGHAAAGAAGRRLAGAGGAAGAASGAGGDMCFYADIKSMARLDECLTVFFDSLQVCDYRLKEVHEYLMSLPPSYYGPGSYTLWLRAGWALANQGTCYLTKLISNKHLFLSWLKFSSRDICRDTVKGADGKFDWRHVPDLYQQWLTFNTHNPAGLTHKSIMYWCKKEDEAAYKRIRNSTSDYFLDQAIKSGADFDLASVLHSLYKDKYVCASVKKRVWFQFNKNRWEETDSANELRMAISKEMVGLVSKKAQEAQNLLNTMDPAAKPAEYEEQKKYINKFNEVQLMLKSSTKKDHIMREASELFYDKDLFEKLDQNRYLMCFSNGVVDFQNNVFRPGQPDDYISKCTNVKYTPLDKLCPLVRAEVEHFMKQLFPIKEVRRYMWDHLASVLIGVNKTQTFNVLIGNGSNGKSKLVELFSAGLGNYVASVPISLITQKRNSIGSTSSEVAQLAGVRYAVMQEPSKGDHINEGVLKELTGGDKITARALFKDSITFQPQFKLVVCTNTDFSETSNDDGTWRRLRYVKFGSLFLLKPYSDEVKYPRHLFPHQYPRDNNLDAKFETWAPVLMSMLVSKAFLTKGIVVDCAQVLANSDKYRESQDFFAAFAKEKIRRTNGDGALQLADLQEEFKNWYILNHDSKVPKQREVKDFMNARYGAYNKGWHGIKVLHEGDMDDAVAGLDEEQEGEAVKADGGDGGGDDDDDLQLMQHQMVDQDDDVMLVD